MASPEKRLPKRAAKYRGAGIASSLAPAAPSQVDAANFTTALHELAQDQRDDGRQRPPSVATTDIDRSVAGPSAKTTAPPLKKRKTAERGKGKAKAKAAAQFVSTVEWPDHFKHLDRVFKALNTVYTFCSGRRHLATTFDTLKGSVESLLKAPVEIETLAQIKALLPELVRFAYIDRELLTIEKEKYNKEDDRDGIYSTAAAGGINDAATDEQEVLFFQFDDGGLKSMNGTGKVIRGKRWFNHKKDGQEVNERQVIVPTPKFAPNAMSKLITARNTRFQEAVSELLVACEAQNPPADPIELLVAATKDYVPVRASKASDDEEDDVPTLGDRKSQLQFYLRNPDKRPSIAQLIQEIQDDPGYKDQIVDGGHRVTDARDAIYRAPNHVTISAPVADALYATRSVNQLYSHQAEAVDALAQGKHVIVSTSTSSGKSLVYQLPLLSALESDPQSCALYIFPTKALAQDQKRSMSDLLASCEGMQNFKVATFDGDTPQHDRDYIRENATVIFTNPDMLHITILPKEEKWRRFFENLKLVVVDELHMYTGLFGCHVAYIMRRLRRICAAVGNRRVQCVSCSATVANPVEHMASIFGLEIKDITLVDQDGSPCGRKEHIVWNPPLNDERNPSKGRVNSLGEASKMFRFLMDRGVRCIVFCKIRRFCELLMKQVKQDLLLEGRSDILDKVMSYRSGYTAQDRRKIEKEMFTGQLLGVISTTALELGIDIGSLDAVITVGFPYTLSGLRQQAGRAGRRKKDSLAMLICDSWPLDQYYAQNPDELFSSPFSTVTLDLENSLVLEGHLQCAAFEMPIQCNDDEPYFGTSIHSICQSCLTSDGQGFYHCHSKFLPYPSQHVSIRNAQDDHYSIVDISSGGGQERILEEIEWTRICFECFEGAIFMNQGRTFLVEQVDHKRKMCFLRQANVDWMTKSIDYTNIDAMETLKIRTLPDSPCFAFYGKIKIEAGIIGYFKVDRRANILDTVDVEMSPIIKYSHGLWLDVPISTLDILRLKDFDVAASIHSAEHAVLGLTPIFVMNVSGDVLTDCKAPDQESSSKQPKKRPARLTFYDASGKSGGICSKAFDRIHELLTLATEALVKCHCSNGCPSCITSSGCRQSNTAKLGARIVLESLLGRHIDVDSIPQQEPLHLLLGIRETIVEAPSVQKSQNLVVVDVDGSVMNDQVLAQEILEKRRRSKVAGSLRTTVDEVIDHETNMGGFVQ